MNHRKEFSMPINNPKMDYCSNPLCRKKLKGGWWIQVHQRVFCRKCYDQTIRTSTKTSK